MDALLIDLPSLEECAVALSFHDYIVGSGKDRIGYRIPGSRWCYKQEHDPSDNTNVREYARYTEILASGKLPEGIRFPEMILLSNGIIASEYINGKQPRWCGYADHSENHNDVNSCWINKVRQLGTAFGLCDSGSSCNVRLVTDNDGKEIVYVIDLGE